MQATPNSGSRLYPFRVGTPKLNDYIFHDCYILSLSHKWGCFLVFHRIIRLDSVGFHRLEGLSWRQLLQQPPLLICDFIPFSNNRRVKRIGIGWWKWWKEPCSIQGSGFIKELISGNGIVFDRMGVKWWVFDLFLWVI